MEDLGDTTSEFGISPLVSSHMHIETQYAHYIEKQQNKVNQMSNTNWDLIDISSINLRRLKKILSNEDYERLALKKP